MPGAESLFGLDDFQITHSCRFNGTAGGGHLHRQPANDGSKRIWTLSVWVKRAKFRTVADREQDIFGAFYASNGSRYSYIAFDHNDRLQIFGGEYDTSSTDQSFYRKTSAVFRDPSAWYHIVWKHDSTDGTASNRDLLYVNGVLQDWSASIGGEFTNLVTGQNEDSYFNTTNSPMRIGEYAASGNMEFDGYMAEMHWVDGTVYAPTVFGKFDSVHGHWKPITVDGVTYGTNGFHIDFNDSGNLGNVQDGLLTDFTVVNLAATDQMLDTPTNNFAVMNLNSLMPLDHDGNAAISTLTEGGLKVLTPRVGSGVAFSSMGVTTGKWYVEVRVGGFDQTGTRSAIGVTQDADATGAQMGQTPGSLDSGQSAGRDITYHGQTGKKFENDTETSGAGAVFGDGDIMGITIDAGSRVCTFYKNNASQFSHTLPAAGGQGSYTPEYFLVLGDTSAGVAMTYNVNFGADSSFAGEETAQGKGASGDDFYYEPPAGFNSFSTKNLPEPTLIPNQNFDCLLYTGNGGGSENDISGLNFRPDFTIIKDYSNGAESTVVDAVRGSARYLGLNSAEAQGNRSTRVKRFTSDGFALGDGNGTSGQNANVDGRSYVAWCWNMATSGTTGGTTSSNHTQSNIDTVFMSNPTAGQSIATYNGSGGNGQGLKHGLSTIAHMWWLKNIESSSVGDDNWQIYHRGLRLSGLDNNTQNLHFNTNEAKANDGVWSYGPVAGDINVNEEANLTEDYVVYTFESIEGYSKMGVSTGNGNANGTFAYCGFRPRLIMYKVINTTGNWLWWDTARSPINVLTDAELSGNATAAQGAGSFGIQLDIVSNGFKFRNSDNTNFNHTDFVYIYYAVAETPFKYANAR